MGTAAGSTGRLRRAIGALLVIAATAAITAVLCVHFQLGAKSNELALRYAVPQAVSAEARAIYERLMPLAAAGSALRAPPQTAEEFAELQAQSAAGTEDKNQQLIAQIGASVAATELGGVPVLDIRPKNYSDDGSVVVFIHGGGWVTGSAPASRGFAARIADASGRRVISVDYTLAPKAQWPQVLDQVVAVYAALLAQAIPPGKIVVSGESAGGNIAAAGTLKLRDQRLPMPAALVLISPGLDFLRKSETYTSLRAADPVLYADASLDAAMRMYADPVDWGNPYVSPVYGDFSKGYPPVLLQLGTKERLLSDAVRLHQAVKMAGGSAELDIYEGMAHGFQSYMNDTPEQRAAFAEIRRYIDRHMAAAAP